MGALSRRLGPLGHAAMGAWRRSGLCGQAGWSLLARARAPRCRPCPAGLSARAMRLATQGGVGVVRFRRAKQTPTVGLEPTTTRLRALRSAD